MATYIQPSQRPLVVPANSQVYGLRSASLRRRVPQNTAELDGEDTEPALTQDAGRSICHLSCGRVRIMSFRIMSFRIMSFRIMSFRCRRLAYP